MGLDKVLESIDIGVIASTSEFGPKEVKLCHTGTIPIASQFTSRVLEVEIRACIRLDRGCGPSLCAGPLAALALELGGLQKRLFILCKEAPVAEVDLSLSGRSSKVCVHVQELLVFCLWIRKLEPARPLIISELFPDFF
ncbi:hypothetical protein ACS49_03800 [Bacillus cereus]|nr:hypothetical protein ACS49_03800 [Bacillus cereus]